MTLPPPPTNLRRLEPSRKHVHPGDLFAMLPPDDLYLFGRVIATDAEIGSMKKVILLYIYAHRAESADVPPTGVLSPRSLLVPPILTNRKGWTLGYFQTIAKIPLKTGDKLPVTAFRDPLSRHLKDEYGQVVGVAAGDPGFYGLASYRTIDDQISRALGIPIAPD